MKPRILVTGANGQLGKELQHLAPSFPGFEFIFLSREDLPIHHFELLRNSLRAWHPDYCINCAAYTAVDRAESEQTLAFQVNGEAVGILAAACKERNCKFIHISTDYVFDGTASHPYQESDPVNPQSVYGASKLEGERQALRFNPDSIVIRTSWVYSEFGKNFVRTMLRLMAEKPEINVVNDQLGSPTYAADLALALIRIIEQWQTRPGGWKPGGIYNYSNEGVISWFDFALAIARQSGSDAKINPIPTSQYPTPARRPAYSALDKSKFRNSFGLPIRDWESALKDCISKIKSAS